MKRLSSATYFRIAVVFLLIVVLGTVAGGVSTGSTITDMVVAITALIGVFALYVESRRGKNIAMGEFILNLNSEFSQDSQRATIHQKLIAGERLGVNDKPAIVAYLTFFEIICRLVGSGVVKMDVIDDLFRSRFFTAVYNSDVQALELLPDADGYRNIYELERRWLAHLDRHGIVLKRGERPLPESARKRASHQLRFSMSCADEADAPAIHDLIVEAAAGTPPDQFYVNDQRTIARQMTQGFAVKGHHGNDFVGLLHVYFPSAEESHASKIGDPFRADQVAHMDIAAVLPKHRGYGLLELLLVEAELVLRNDHPHRIAWYATVSPDNRASRRSFDFSGYRQVGHIEIHEAYPRVVLRKLAE